MVIDLPLALWGVGPPGLAAAVGVGVVWTSLRAEVDLWWGDFCRPPTPPPEEAPPIPLLEGLVGVVSKIMLARKLSSMLVPPGVPLLRRETGTDPGLP